MWREASARWRNRNYWQRYGTATASLSKKDKGRILDDFIAVAGHHRKHGIRLLGQTGDAGEKLSMIQGRRI